MVPLLMALAQPGPANPHVRLPESWKVAYGVRTINGRGALIGPGGEEIGFPAGAETGRMADVLASMDRRTLVVSTDLEGPKVRAALTPDGLLAVSFPQEGRSSSLPPFDFWRRTKDARKIVETLSIVLTRAEWERDTLRSLGPSVVGAMVLLPSYDSRVDPFPRLKFPTAFRDLQFAKAGGRLLSKFEPKIELVASLPDGPAWIQRLRILDGTLAVEETKDGHLAATYEPLGIHIGNDRRAVLVMDKATPENAVVAVFAALSYRAPEP